MLDRGDPIAATQVFIKAIIMGSLHLKQNEETHVRSSSLICSGLRLYCAVCDLRVGLGTLVMKHASLLGLLVKKETTSKLTTMSD